MALVPVGSLDPSQQRVWPVAGSCLGHASATVQATLSIRHSAVSIVQTTELLVKPAQQRAVPMLHSFTLVHLPQHVSPRASGVLSVALVPGAVLEAPLHLMQTSVAAWQVQSTPGAMQPVLTPPLAVCLQDVLRQALHGPCLVFAR